ncbi:MAG: AbrB/MazE/SpoVT family DNA-binding domain-containing protein [Halobacteria archaeon]|nr:AbrB/MazE/SpoVT family DNA-binding domain-containing protein [Halobacteria archaeon]
MPFPTPASIFAKQMQEAGEQAVEQQTEMMKRMMGAGAGGSGGFGQLSNQLNAMSTGMATFKARVQSGGRISIPDTEREALGIDEGDVVQTFIIPVNTDK